MKGLNALHLDFCSCEGFGFRPKWPPVRVNGLSVARHPQKRKPPSSHTSPQQVTGPARTAESAPTPRLPRKWSWKSRLAALVLSPLLAFAALEGGLRMAGYGYPTGFFLPRSEGGKPVLIENDRFGWRFLGRALARSPYPVVLPAEKPTGAVRVFVLGESAAYGDPQPDFGLPRLLRAFLEARYPGTRFEVVNAAMTAINSHALLPIARDCAQQHGDVWVVYMGNNEVVGPFGSGTVFGSQVGPLPVIRASLQSKPRARASCWPTWRTA